MWSSLTTRLFKSSPRKGEAGGKEEGKMKERKERTDRLAKLFVETNDLLAEMERSVIAGLRKEINRESSFRKREAELKGE